jgi:hypothetical protein
MADLVLDVTGRWAGSCPVEEAQALANRLNIIVRVHVSEIWSQDFYPELSALEHEATRGKEGA